MALRSATALSATTAETGDAPLRIGYLVQQFVPEVGAGPARVAEMAKHWIRRGAQVTVITGMPNRPEGRIHAAYRGKLFMEEEWEGIRVLRSWLYASPLHGFSRTLLNNVSFMMTSALYGTARAQGLDVLIASSPPFFPHLSGALLGRMRRVPLVLELRDLWPDYLVQLGMLKPGRAAGALFALERKLLRDAAHTVVVTEAFRRRVADKGVPREKIDVISNGVDTGFYYRRADAAPPLPGMGRVEGELLVGYLGNFGAGQGLEAVVDAARRLAGQGMRFVLAGDGPDWRRISALAEEVPGVAVHPPIPKEATPAFYNACDLFLVPLAPVPVFQETVPSKIFEVMACETPVVAVLEGEGAKIVNASGGGWVTPPGDGAALAATLLAARDTPVAERARMGRQGRAYVGEHYSREGLAERYLGILRDVAAARGAGRMP